MKKDFYIKTFKSFEDAEIFDLTQDALLSPTEKFFQGRDLVKHAYAWTNREFPAFEKVMQIAELEEKENDDGLILGVR